MPQYQKDNASWRAPSDALRSNKCSICNGKGATFFERDGMSFAKICDCVRRENIKKRLKFAQVPEILRDCKIIDFKTDIYKSIINQNTAKIAKLACTNYVDMFEDFEQRGKGLYLYSAMAGSGKTKLAVALGNEINEKYEKAVTFTTTLDLLQSIKSTFGSPDASSKSQSHTDLMSAYAKTDVLILDDIGTERPTQWVEEIFFQIVNSRCEAKKVTIFTSNCEIESLSYQPKIKQRIAKLAIPIAFPEESVREQISKQENEQLFECLITRR